MALANNDDLFLVNRNDTTYSLRQDELMASIQADDLMVINRNDVTYKITGEEVIDSFLEPLVIDEVIINNMSPLTESTISVTVEASGGRGPYTLTYQWSAKSTAKNEAERDLTGEIQSTLYLAADLEDWEVACTVTLTDVRSSNVSKQSAFTNPIGPSAKPPVIDTVTITKATAGPDRFTNQTFDVNIQMTEDGIPTSLKTLQVKTVGQFVETPESDTINNFEVVNASYQVTGAGIDNATAAFMNRNNQLPQYGQLTVGQGMLSFYPPFPLIMSVGQKVGVVPGIPSNLGGFFLDTGAGLTGITNKQWNWNVPFNNYEIYGIGMTFGGFESVVAMFYSEDRKYFRDPGPSGTNGFAFDDKYPIITLNGTTNLEHVKPGDRVSVSGGSGEGVVWRVVNNQVFLKMDDYSGTFPAGSRLILPPAPVDSSVLYAILDNTGNVLDFSTSQPGVVYTSNEVSPTTMNITFPATLPGGLTPDQELLDGTSLQATVTTTNSAGVDGPDTATITPGTVTVAGMSAQQVAQMKLLVSTYESRKALTARPALIQELLSEGYTQAEIDAVLGS